MKIILFRKRAIVAQEIYVISIDLFYCMHYHFEGGYLSATARIAFSFNLIIPALPTIPSVITPNVQL